jgi:hypothetical protein
MLNFNKKNAASNEKGSSPDSAVSMTRGIRIYIAKKRKYIKNDRSGEEDFVPHRPRHQGCPYR